MELKPCKCGGTEVFSYPWKWFGTRHTIVCCNCGHSVRGRSFENTCKKWNRRVGEGEKE